VSSREAASSEATTRVSSCTHARARRRRPPPARRRTPRPATHRRAPADVPACLPQRHRRQRRLGAAHPDDGVCAQQVGHGDVGQQRPRPRATRWSGGVLHLAHHCPARRVRLPRRPGAAGSRCSTPAPAGAATPFGRGGGRAGRPARRPPHGPVQRALGHAGHGRRPCGRAGQPSTQRIVVVLLEPLRPRKPVTRPASAAHPAPTRPIGGPLRSRRGPIAGPQIPGSSVGRSLRAAGPCRRSSPIGTPTAGFSRSRCTVCGD
jgi:hypothetical protein